jgi:hypothetical protein
MTSERSLAKDKFSDRRSQSRNRFIGACDLSMMMLAIISFRRSLLQSEQGAILCDSWFHIRFAGLCRRAMLGGFFRLGKARFVVVGFSGQIVYLKTRGKLRAFI